MLFLIPEYSDFFTYFLITSVIFFLFFFLIVIFGYIILKFGFNKLFNITKKIPILLNVFLSYGVGLSVYISLSYFLLIFKAFNFYFAYLPLIIIDFSFFLLLIIRKEINREKLKTSCNNFILKIKRNKKHLISIFIALAILLFFQFSFQWALISRSKALIFEDTYTTLEAVSTLTYDGILNEEFSSYFYYPPGFNIFCSGALLISKNHMIIYNFLKFGSINILFLFVLLIFSLTLEIFKRIYISFVSSMLFLSSYLYTFRMNAFLSSYIATFFICISFVIFITDNKNISLLGFFIPLIYSLNAIAAFYYYILIFFFLILFITKAKKYSKIFLRFFIITLIIFIPFILYLQSLGINIIDLFEWYYKLTLNTTSHFQSPSFIIYLTNIIPVDGIIDFFFGGPIPYVFKLFPETFLFFLIFSLLGLIYRNSRKNNTSKSIHLLAILSLFIILFSTNPIVYDSISSGFFITYHIRILTFYSPLIVILCGFGIRYIDVKIRKSQLFLKKKREKFINIYLFLFIFFLTISSISIHLDQKEVSHTWLQYRHDDNTIESYFYLRTTVPQESKILVPNLTRSQNYSAINKWLYDMELYVSPFNLTTTFLEFEQYIIVRNLEYFLLEKSNYGQHIFNNLSYIEEYESIFENPKYYIYKAN